MSRDAAKEDQKKCSWASCQNRATRGNLCEGHAKQSKQSLAQPDPILVQAEMKTGDVKPPKFEPSAAIQSPEYTTSKCEACGNHHGSVQAELGCLRGKLDYFKKELISARNERDRFREIVSRFEPNLTNGKGQVDERPVEGVEGTALLQDGKLRDLPGEDPPAG